jgi:uncharacterized protein involved in exopolysaccharide biosynthesis
MSFAIILKTIEQITKLDKAIAAAALNPKTDLPSLKKTSTKMNKLVAERSKKFTALKDAVAQKEASATAQRKAQDAALKKITALLKGD